LWSSYKRQKFIPFNPVDKFTMAVIEDANTGQVLTNCTDYGLGLRPCTVCQLTVH